jgi:hypothetical protein
MSGHDDFAFEPVPGLPAALPKGERILWQGRPRTLTLAREALRLNWVAGYFVLLALWKFAGAASAAGVGRGLATAIPFLLLGVIACMIVVAIAWAQARGTVYTLTTARVVMRIGAALQVTYNLPFRQIAAAGLDLRRGGTGTIALRPADGTRLAYLALWPHARPWHLRHPEPALRCIPDAERVATLLAEAAETRLNVPQVGTVAGLAAVAAE